MLKSWLHSEGSLPIALFKRLFFLIMVIEAWGAIGVGWVNQVYIEPEFLFTFMGFEFLSELPKSFYYGVFAVMGGCFLFIALAKRNRWLELAAVLLWCIAYFSHKTSYNNHHYLYGLMLSFFLFMPTINRFKNNGLSVSSVPKFWRASFVLFLGIVYFYAAIAKLYPDWFSGRVLSMWLGPKEVMPWLDWFYNWDSLPIVVAFGGFFYDLLIIPLLTFKPTRKYAFWASLVFHLTNSITFQIGTFPYIMIAATVLFYSEAELIRIFKFKFLQPKDSTKSASIPTKIIRVSMLVFMVVQALLPLRHHLFNSNVFWSEEGHKLSWRMMLRSKSATLSFTIIDAEGKRHYHSPAGIINRKQYYTMAIHPDMIWQYVQRLKIRYGKGCQIFAISKMSLNGRDYRPLIKPDVDLAKVEWEPFKSADWITPFAGWEAD